MRFRQYDNLRSFVVVARYLNMGQAANELNLSKGAVSYQIRQLEAELGFSVFSRSARNLALTAQGTELRQLCTRMFDGIERRIVDLRQHDHQRITIGMATYFASFPGGSQQRQDYKRLRLVGSIELRKCFSNPTPDTVGNSTLLSLVTVP